MAKGQQGAGENGSWRVISQTAEYALRSVLYIARRPGDARVPAAEIARVLRVPERYLARVLNTLRRTGVLESVRGAHGGFRLAMPARGITLLEVVGPFEPVGEAPPCLLRGQRCGEEGSCSAHAAWNGVAAGVRDFFRNTTIEDLTRGEAGGVAA
jgi:Rrf2 family protein